MSKGLGRTQLYALRFLMEAERVQPPWLGVGAPVPFITRGKWFGWVPEAAARTTWSRRVPIGTAAGEAMRRALRSLEKRGLVAVDGTAGHGWNHVRLTQAGRLEAVRQRALLEGRLADFVVAIERDAVTGAAYLVVKNIGPGTAPDVDVVAHRLRDDPLSLDSTAEVPRIDLSSYPLNKLRAGHSFKSAFKRPISQHDHNLDVIVTWDDAFLHPNKARVRYHIRWTTAAERIESY